MFRLKFSVPNAPEFDRALAGLAANVRSIRPMADDVIDKGIKPVLAEQFASQGAESAHGSWAPLSEAYLKWKSRHYGDQSILVASGRMREGLLGTTGDTIREVSDTEVRYGIGGEAGYAVFHQMGTSRMISRRIFDWTVEQQDRVMKAFQSGLIGYLTRLGYAVGAKAGLRDLTPGEARQIGVQQLARGAAITSVA